MLCALELDLELAATIRRRRLEEIRSRCAERGGDFTDETELRFNFAVLELREIGNRPAHRLGDVGERQARTPTSMTNPVAQNDEVEISHGKFCHNFQKSKTVSPQALTNSEKKPVRWPHLR